MNGLTEKTEFVSWKFFLKAKKAYEEASKTLLVTRGSCVMKGDDEKSVNFRYTKKIYNCKAGSQKPTKSKGHRSSATYKMDCPVTVSVQKYGKNAQSNYFLLILQLKIEFNGKKLIITESMLNHQGHGTDQQTFDHYPENMKLSPEHQKLAESMISLDCNKKKIKVDLMKLTGKPVAMETLHNLQTNLQNGKSNSNGNDLQKLFDALTATEGSTVRFIANEANEFVGKYIKS